MKIYIDVTNIVNTNFITGIQRVVREIVVRLLKDESFETIIFSWPSKKDKLSILNKMDFLARFDGKDLLSPYIRQDKELNLSAINRGDIFFDIDAVWNSTNHNRNFVYPILKEKGVKIICYLYDLIPIKFPAYCHEGSLFDFMQYTEAVLSHADTVMCSTQAVLNDVFVLCDKLNLPKMNGVVTWLGSDFAISNASTDVISDEAKKVVESGRYILMVGTIEPRKNHNLILDAYDSKLSEMGINVVFVGKQGWNVDNIMKRIKKNQSDEKRFFHLIGQNDSSVDYLYKNAFVVAFPTFDEGFGLPMVEAFQRGVLVLASDIPVMQEVGGEFADYFDPKSVESFISLVEKYVNDSALYKTKKEKITKYEAVTWDKVEKTISNNLMYLSDSDNKNSQIAFDHVADSCNLCNPNLNLFASLWKKETNEYINFTLYISEKDEKKFIKPSFLIFENNKTYTLPLTIVNKSKNNYSVLCYKADLFYDNQNVGNCCFKIKFDISEKKVIDLPCYILAEKENNLLKIEMEIDGETIEASIPIIVIEPFSESVTELEKVIRFKSLISNFERDKQISELRKEISELRRLITFTKNRTLWGFCSRVIHKIIRRK